MWKHRSKKYKAAVILASIFLIGAVGATLLEYWQSIHVDVNLLPSLTIDGKDYTEPITDSMSMQKGDKEVIVHLFANSADQQNVTVDIEGLENLTEGMSLSFRELGGDVLTFPLELPASSSIDIEFIYKSDIMIEEFDIDATLNFTATEVE